MNKPIIKIYKKEQNMINAKITDIPVPVTRTEHFMYSAITGNESGLKADTQAEMYLDAIKNSDTSDLEGLEPRTVLDMYLEARQTGVIGDLPKPRTTSEMLLYQAITGEDLGAKPVSNMDKYLSLLESNNYDARLEIESESSIIKLTDSKDGVVEVKELEGNTLVNLYNNSFTYVTTGKGNYVKENNGVTVNNTSTTSEYYVLLNQPINLKTNTLHTLLIDIEAKTDYQIFTWFDNNIKLFVSGNSNVKLIKTFVSGQESTRFRFDSDTPGGTVKFKNIMILEGDWTNKEVPTEYFEGMKSVGECEDNKIEILSQNKNLIVNSNTVYTFENYDDTSRKSTKAIINLTSNFKNIIRNKKIILGVKAKGENLRVLEGVPHMDRDFHYGFDINVTYADGTSQWLSLTKGIIPSGTFEETYYTREFVIPDKEILGCSTKQLFCRSAYGKLILSEPMVMIVDDNTIQKNFVPHLSNKKEITLQEPLRGLPNGVRDKIVVKNGKLMIERRIGSYTFTGNEALNFDPSIYSTWNMYTGHFVNKKDDNSENAYVCNTMKTCHFNYNIDVLTGKNIGSNFVAGFNFQITKTEFGEGKTQAEFTALFKQWLKDNPTTVLYEKATPTYEEITPELQELILECYNNATLFFNTNIPPKSLISYTANTSNIYKYLDTLKLSKAERDSIINSMERV